MISASTAVRTEPRTGAVRRFDRRDLPAVVRLHRATFASRRMTGADLERYLEEVFCNHPWIDEAYPSLVFESRPGQVTGCLGVMPRPMTFHGRPIVAAVSHHFMVDPEERSTMAAMQMLKIFFDGPQQLSLAEGNELSRRMWDALHAATIPAYSLHWLRPLRPARLAGAAMRNRRGLKLIAQLLHPVTAAGDALASRVGWSHPARPSAGTVEALTPMLLAATVERMRGTRALWPRYDTTSLSWLFAILAGKRSSGDLQAKLVRDKRGEIAGWFIYYLRRDAAGEVLQLAGHDRALRDVYAHLVWDAYEAGAAALTGRLEPALLPACAADRCWLKPGKSWMLAHTSQRDLVAALYQGDAFLSPLEGEWWMST